MKKTVRQYVEKFMKDKIQHQRAVSILCILSILVAGGVFWQLRFVGITKTAEACCGYIAHHHDESCGVSKTLICGMDESQAQAELICTLQEHTHTDTCYEERETLVCTETEEAHEHNDECYATEQALTCTAEEHAVDHGTECYAAEMVLTCTIGDGAHVHSEACYTKEHILTCTTEEHVHSEACWGQTEAGHIHTDGCYETTYECGLTEHEHTISCYADINADIETAADWEATLPNQLSGIWTEDLVAVAKSQLGYQESERNFILAEDGESELGYTRYGAWYGNAYGHWDAMFVSFCLSYAQIPKDHFPLSSGSSAFAVQIKDMGLYIESEPQAGDIVLFSLESQADHIGIVTAVNEGTIYAIEGDVDGAVTENSYSLGDSRIAGYGRFLQEDIIPQDGSPLEETEERMLIHTGEDYTVSALFRFEAAIPETAELAVREIMPGTEEYDGYYGQTLAAMQLDAAPIFCRFFDVSFVNGGEEIEPLAPVNVTITYAETLPLVEDDKCTAVHFAEDGLEILETQVEATADGNAVMFTQDSFSVVGTVIEGTVSLSSGLPYIFYTGDGYALGVTQGYYGYSVTRVAVTIGNNGYITPASAGVGIENIVWYSRNGGLVSAATVSGYGTGQYLNLVSSTPQIVYGTHRYTSTIGLTNSVNTLLVHVINNTVRLSDVYSTYSPFMLAYENGVFKSGTEFDNAELYFLTANVVDVQGHTGEPGDLEIQDDIRATGCIKPKWNITQPGSVLTYVWEKSLDNGNTWSQVERRKVTGEYYNIAEDGSWLNVALDNGAEMQYRVSLVAVDGSTLLTPYTSEVYFVPYYDELKNGDFEIPHVYDGTSASVYQPFIPNGTYGMVWKTTALDGQIEYISVESSEFQQLSQRWHLCEAAFSGEQYVELNATRAGALYQDVLTVPGSTMYWKLAHRARGTSYLSGEHDTMYVVIMSTQLAEQYNITTQSAVSNVINNPSAYPGAFVRTITSDNTAWQTYSDQYGVPEGQYLSRYFFVAGNTASHDNTVGNHLDKVAFSTALPPPDPEKVNIEIEKTLKGLSREQALEVMERLAFYIYDEQSSEYLADIDGDQFGLLKDNGDGSFTASYMVPNLDAGSYRVMEDTNNNVAEVTGYNRTTLVNSAQKLQDSYYDNGYYCLRVYADAGETINVEFENSYLRQTVDVTLLKKNDEGTMLTADFALAKKEGEVWNIQANVTTNNGQVILTALSFDTLYRLTETKAPDGYVALAEPLYFMIKDDGIVFCNAEGENIGATAIASIVNNTITVINQMGYALPETGGSGSARYAITGLLLMAVTIMLECRMRHKRERRLTL